ncbi:MAG: hypothetical protein J5649_07965 [Lachnospiraceae bacterium]|nr:hypothetical protein [Lachnospiraceae bacterium]
MFMRRRLQSDDRGIALISVMICVMLCFLLSATIMRISLLSYLQKGIGKQSTSTFYENESFVDDIKLGVQQKVAVAFAESSSTSQTAFISNFKSKLLTDGVAAGASATATDKEKLEAALKSYISNSNPTLKIVSLTVDGDGSGNCFVDDGEGEVVIKNVRIEYTDDSKGGYVSNIKTDIRIRSPFYITTTTSTQTSRYSMIAGGGTSALSADSQDTILQVAGSYYSGYNCTNARTNAGYTVDANGVATATAIEIGGNTLLYFTESDSEKAERVASGTETNSLVLNGDMIIKGNAKVVLMGGTVVVRGTIYLQGNGKLIVDKETTLICRDIQFTKGVTTYKAATDTYNGSSSLTHLPYPKKPKYTKSQADKVDSDYDNKGALFICDTARSSIVIGTNTNDLKATVKEASFSGGKVKSGSNNTNIKLTNTGQYDSDASVPSTNPESNIRKSDGNYYDPEYCALVDVEWFLKGMSESNHIAPTANTVTGTGALEEKDSATKESDAKLKSGNKFYFTSGHGGSSDTNGKGEDQNSQNINGKNVKICIGNHDSMLSTSNYTDSIFYLTTHAISFNDMNWDRDARLVMLSSKSVAMKPKDGGIVRIVPMSEWFSSENAYKAFIDQIGLHLARKDASQYNQYNIVNNYFVGGIKTLYTREGGSGTETITTENDVVMNKTLEVVSFENWEKY